MEGEGGAKQPKTYEKRSFRKTAQGSFPTAYPEGFPDHGAYMALFESIR